MLLLAPLLLTGGVETHLGHEAGGATLPVFTDARHGEQPSHLEASGAAHFGHCADCLMPTQPWVPATTGRGVALREAARPMRLPAADRLPEPAAAGSRQPRAPPLSSWS